MTAPLRMFPVTVQLPDGPPLAPALVVMREGVLEVYAHRDDYPHGAPRKGHIVQVLQADQVTVEARTNRALTVTWEDGTRTLTATRDSSCGCGHPLKRFRP